MVYRLEGDYGTVIEKLSELEKECSSILEKHAGTPKEEFLGHVDVWEDEVIQYLCKRVNPVPEFLVDDFHKSSLTRFSDEVLIFYKGEGEEIVWLQENIIHSKIKSLKKLKGYLLILNNINQEPQNEVEEIQDKMDYVMDKLHLVFDDDFFYSIDCLLQLNGIQYRSGETKELGESLYKKGYVKVADKYDKTHFAKLTVKGASYVERKRKSAAKKRVLKREKELNEKVDVVLDKLQKLGYGQEIIFDEIEELKSLSGKLKKKTWVQLLKGKVVDMAMEEVINRETASYILETFTEEASKLLPK